MVNYLSEHVVHVVVHKARHHVKVGLLGKSLVEFVEDGLELTGATFSAVKLR